VASSSTSTPPAMPPSWASDSGIATCCRIAGQCYADGSDNPQNPCEVCDLSLSQSSWTVKPVGAVCDDGVFCNGLDRCDASSTCAQHDNRACDEGDLCQTCDEASRSCVYSPSMTWYDPKSDLTWQVVPASESLTYEPAKDRCAALTFCGQRGWRLPTIGDLRALIRGCPATQTGGLCGVTDSCTAHTCQTGECSICTGKGPAPNGEFWPAELQGHAGYTYSSSLRSDNMQFAWFANFATGRIEALDKGPNGSGGMTAQARCVRSGQ
jgi:hypothetical protein